MHIIANSISDKELIEACGKGDTKAISIFYERYKDLIYSAIHKWISKYAKEIGNQEREEDVKEIFNEAIIYIMENNFAKAKQARDPDRISGLVFLLAYQVTGRYFKKKWISDKRKGRGEPAFPPIEDGILDRLGRDERIRFVGEFMETLIPEEQKIMELRFSEGLKYREIADETGLTTTHVGVIINRVKEELNIFIKERYGAGYEI